MSSPPAPVRASLYPENKGLFSSTKSEFADRYSWGCFAPSAALNQILMSLCNSRRFKAFLGCQGEEFSQTCKLAALPSPEGFRETAKSLQPPGLELVLVSVPEEASAPGAAWVLLPAIFLLTLFFLLVVRFELKTLCL